MHTTKHTMLLVFKGAKESIDILWCFTSRKRNIVQYLYCSIYTVMQHSAQALQHKCPY